MSESTGTAPGTVARAGKRRLGLLIVPVAIFAAVAGLFAIALRTSDPSKLPSALIGKPVPAFELPPLEGLSEAGRPIPGVSAADLAKGKVTVVNFWASWCVPCVEEHPLLIELGKRTGVTLYGINYKDQTVAARRFLGNFGNPFAGVGVDGNGRTGIDWGVYGMPESFVVDGQGRIVYKHIGPLTKASLDNAMIPAIEAARSGRPLQTK